MTLLAWLVPALSEQLKLVEPVGYKRGATDFSGQVSRVQGANSDVLLIATRVGKMTVTKM